MTWWRELDLRTRAIVGRRGRLLPTAQPGVPASPYDELAGKTATSAKAGGGQATLITAAKAEGTLNVIALRPTWTNYAEQLSTFHKQHGSRSSPPTPTAPVRTS